MYNGKFVSLDRICENILRDTGMQYELDYYDVMEWVGYCLDLIGANQSYVQKVTNGKHGMPKPIEIDHFKGLLPCDCHEVIMCRENKHGYPMKASTDVFLQDYTSDLNGELENEYLSRGEMSYRISGNYIQTTMRKGHVEMSYWAYALDDKGLPLIPDNNSVILAVQWYITERLDYKGWRKGLVSDKVYNYSEVQKNWYLAQAQNSMAMPTVSEMESLKNQLVRLYQNPNHFATNFKHLNVQESINLGPYHLRVY